MSTRKPPAAGKRTGSAPTAAQRRLSAERAAAARTRIAAAQRRRRLLVVGGSIAGVLLLVAALVVVKVATGAGGPKSGSTAGPLPAAVQRQLTSVPAATLDAVGAGSIATLPSPVTAPALTRGGLPQVLYVGAEYCPYCAAERWAVTQALALRHLPGLRQTTSSPSDVYPSTATLSFHGASFTSPVLAFTARELQSNQVVDGRYAPLDTLSADEQKIFDTYDAAPYVKSAGSIPFVDIGGRYLISGASYDPGVLQGKSQSDIAAALADRTSPIAKAVDGTANVVTAAICAATGQRPSAVCSATGVGAGAAKLTATS